MIDETLKNERLKEIKQNPKGYTMWISGYRSSQDVDIEFENGEKILHTRYSRFREGNICIPSEAPIKREGERHGDRYTKLWKEWNTMLWRCNPKNKRHHIWYSDKGIKVCDEWQKYTVFKEWALHNGFQEDLTIDRVDETKDYSPLNCRWITLAENVRRIKKHPFIKVAQYDLNGEFVAYFNSLSKANRSIGNRKDDNNIRDCCNGKIQNYKGYVWKYANK